MARKNQTAQKPQVRTTVRLPEDLADDAEAVSRVKGTSLNALIIDALKAKIERVRQDADSTNRAKRLPERDRKLLKRLAQRPAT